MPEALSCPLGPIGEVTPTTAMCKLQKARHEWAKALAFDSLEDSDEVAFSPNNPHVKKYDELMNEFIELKRILEGRN